LGTIGVEGVVVVFRERLFDDVRRQSSSRSIDRINRINRLQCARNRRRGDARTLPTWSKFAHMFCIGFAIAIDRFVSRG
jgi:hypothetical protein